jgi:hypothetical protein
MVRFEKIRKNNTEIMIMIMKSKDPLLYHTVEQLSSFKHINTHKHIKQYHEPYKHTMNLESQQPISKFMPSATSLISFRASTSFAWLGWPSGV